MSEWIKKLTEKYSEVNENQKAAMAKKLAKASASSEKGKAAVTLPKAPFEIPESIPANERTAFHGAAAAAHKAGQSHFSFQGKKYPVTMKKDTAKAIADDVQEGKVDEISMGKMSDYANAAVKDIENKRNTVKKAMSTGKVKDYDDAQKAMKGLRRRSKGSDMYVDKMMGRGKVKPTAESEEGDVTMNPKKEKNQKAVDTAVMPEAIEWKVYSRILENREAHYKGATPPQENDDGMSPNAKKMKRDQMAGKDVRNDDEKGHDDAEKAARITKAAPARNGDRKEGDKAIINKPEDITQKGGMKG